MNNPMDKLICMIVKASEAWVQGGGEGGRTASRSGAQAMSSEPSSVMKRGGKELGGKAKWGTDNNQQKTDRLTSPGLSRSQSPKASFACEKRRDL